MVRLYVKRKNYVAAKKIAAKKYKKKTKITRGVPLKVKTYVKKAISREIETNMSQKLIFNQNNTVGYGLNNTSIPTLGLSSSSYFANIIPTVAVGDGTNNRHGQKIRVKGLYVKYSLRAIDVSNGSTNDNPFKPFWARVIIYSHKFNRADSSNDGILQTGSGSAELGSAPETWFEPYDKEEYNIHYSKQFMMVPARRVTGSAVPNQFAQDAIVPGSHTFVFRKEKLKGVPQTFLYDDASFTGTLANLPTNAAYHMAVCVCNINGDANTTDQRLMVNAEAFMYYTDA